MSTECFIDSDGTETREWLESLDAVLRSQGPARVSVPSVTTMKNYLVTDSNGRQYRPVGAYVMAQFGGTPYIEIQYFPESAEMTGRGVRPWERLKERRLRGEYTYVFLYLVEPGAKLVRFTTGGGGARTTDPVDLGDMDLVAPK